MISNRIVAFYVERLTYEDAYKFAAKYGVHFNQKELEILVPFLKSHKNDLHRKQKLYLMEETKKVVEPTTYQKVCHLLDQLLP